MIDEQLLRQGLQKLLEEIESAIRDRLFDEPELENQLKEHHDAAVRAERTEGSEKGYNAFADDAITQAAVHWILACVFVRFLEDNGWLDERNAKVAWIAGTGDRLTIAKGRRTLFLRPDPNLTDRDYLLTVFGEVSKLPGVAGLFDKHNPLFSLQPTGQGAAKMVEFFQRVDTDSNFLIHDFSNPAHDTRFLGDLYQNLSESARKRYALCQTPGFVIDFILDRTLTPALDAFGLTTVRLIDPSCGSGHFVLAAFSRLFSAWQSKEPATNPPALVQRALNAVYGVDLNPFAIEISRFRLLIAALESSDIERLKDAPNFSFNLAAGDSLLHGSRIGGGGIERSFFEDRLQYFYDTEDAGELKRILGQTYHVVVGNPPYINVHDAALREAYRARFSTCHGQYQLGVPFTERFFDLTVEPEKEQKVPAGWMSMIVSNAFMKRSFGKKLIEQYLCRLDLTHVIDTSGVYIPGHGTPTTILIARHRSPLGSSVRAVRGIRGETGVPSDPANAPVWREIVEHLDQDGFQGSNVSVADAPRDSFAQHPWAIGGGGAAELRTAIEDASQLTLVQIAQEIGCHVVSRAEDAFVTNRTSYLSSLPSVDFVELVLGEDLRDWTLKPSVLAIWPYDPATLLAQLSPETVRFLYPLRTTLRERRAYGMTQLQRGLQWFEYSMIFRSRVRASLSIGFSDIATHNHFVLDRGGKVFNSHASTIILAGSTSENHYLELLGILNSSVACFWLRQVCYPKGGDHVGTEGARVSKHQWEERYEFDSTKLKQFPISANKPLEITKLIETEVETRLADLPARLCLAGTPTRLELNNALDRASASLARMIALQEELDWQCYRMYGIVEEDLTLDPAQVQPLKLGERAFEIVLARKQEEPLWFERHHSTPITEVPEHWPADSI